MTNHPLEQPNPITVNGEDGPASTQPLRKRDRFLKAFGFSKSETKVKIKTSNQSLTVQVPHHSVDLALADHIASEASFHSQSVVVSDAPEGRIMARLFPKNLPKPAIKADLPRLRERFEKTEQLVYCSTLLHRSQSLSSAIATVKKGDEAGLDESEKNSRQRLYDEDGITLDLNESEKVWVQALQEEPVEQYHLRWLITSVVEEFVKDDIKGSAVVAEAVILGPVLDRDTFRSLLSCFIKKLERATLLDINLLQGLVQLVEGAPSGHLEHDDLVRTLAVLRQCLKGTHKPSLEYLYQTVIAVSRLLDVMVNSMIKDLNRTEDHQPLTAILEELKDTKDPTLQFQVNYALQALQYVPDDESPLQAIMRFAGGVSLAALGVASIYKLDPANLFISLDTLRQAAGQSYEVTKSILEGMEASQRGRFGAMQSLLRGIRAGTKHEWYLTLLAARIFVQDGRLADFKRTILGEIAVDSLWSPVSRQHAVDFLGALFSNNANWQQHPDVKQWIFVILIQLSGHPDAVVKDHAASVLQVLDRDSISTLHTSYPFWNRLSLPEVSPLLVRVQMVPYVEHDLHVMVMRRLEETQLQVYIPPMAKANLQARDDDIFPLMTNVQEFLASNRRVMLILGDSGAGKSTFNKHLESLLLRTYKINDPIPLFVNLPAFEKPATDVMTEQLKEYNFSDAQILELKLHRKFVLICDGYDESQLAVNLHTTNKFNQPGQWDVKMVISCRTQYLGPDYRDRFVPQGSSHYNRPAFELFQEAVIAPFSKKQIQAYVEQYASLEPRTWTAQDYLDKLTTIPNLMDLVKNPFLLSLALEAIPGVTKDKQDPSTIRITRVQLYDTFVNHWLNVNKQRLQCIILSKEDRAALDQLLEAGFVTMGIEYSIKLASAIFSKQNGKAVVRYVHLKDKSTWKVEFFGSDPDIRLLRDSSPLARSGSYYQFLHRSMLEYFFSCAIVCPSHPEHENKVDPPVVLDSSDIQSLDPDCPLFSHNLLTEPSVVQFLSERVQENSDFKRQLLKVVEKSKSDTSMATAAANAMTILVRAGVTFHRYDFRHICIPGADLSGGQFDSAQFQGADLTNVDFGMSWLRKADFSNAQMQGVQFGELPYLREDKAVRACLHSPDGKMLAVGLGDGSVTVYNTLSWRLILKLSGHTDYTITLAFSPDSQRLVTGSEDSRMWIWDCNNGDALLFLGGHTAGVTSVAYSPCGKQVVSASWDGTVRLWNTTTGDALFVLEGHVGSVNGVRFTADGRRLVSGGHDGTIRFWDAETGAAGDVWELDRGRVQCLAISPDGLHVASGHSDGTLMLWNTSTGSAGHDLRGHTQIIMSVMFSANGQQVASAAFDSTVRLWDSLAGVLVAVFGSSSPIVDVSFAPNGLQLASADILDKIRLWDGSRLRSVI
ncbi:hypothetical protein BGZ96_009247 [Linnemannia gamsii]|uniref:Arm-like repeat domain-containing protein n=1 Tax=Linnemannia gamsii TaxID=64522 RepID=A0ABQ7JWL7_9FUNG|nr:hypothetical protein BGZ96_009247 [Linnemannia gamsii]